MKIICAHCGKKSEKPKGHVNLSNRKGAPLFCDRKCAGLGRRIEKTAAQRKEEKRLYDLAYREKNRDWLTMYKQMAYQRDKDPVKEAAYRKRFAERHKEYCRTPEYRAWKQQYDKQHRAKNIYGEFSEAFLLLMEIEQEVESRASNYDIRGINGTRNKTQERKRSYERTIHNNP